MSGNGKSIVGNLSNWSSSFVCFAALEVPMAIHLKNDPLSCQIFYTGSSHGITAEFHQRSYPPFYGFTDYISRSRLRPVTGSNLDENLEITD
ncbi:MAG: hypothetical protein AMJ61_13785 [Desulfobacterales bacterium SG8_35_2]|nr:MAG: hypothetical protein AMJ61_13785 [Desulfobacterales bacterium SG8_35_2]